MDFSINDIIIFEYQCNDCKLNRDGCPVRDLLISKGDKTIDKFISKDKKCIMFKMMNNVENIKKNKEIMRESFKKIFKHYDLDGKVTCVDFDGNAGYYTVSFFDLASVSPVFEFRLETGEKTELSLYSKSSETYETVATGEPLELLPEFWEKMFIYNLFRD